MGEWRAFEREVGEPPYTFKTTGYEYVPDPGEDVAEAARKIQAARDLIRDMFRANSPIADEDEQ
jgi:hypothetical protein